MDADGSHAPEELPKLLDALRDADVVLGSRWVPGGKVRQLAGAPAAALPRRQHLHPAGAGHAVHGRHRRLPGVPDARCWTRSTSTTVASQGYCFQVDLAWRAHRHGFRIVEVPITFAERERGASKMSSQHRPRGAVAGHRVGCAGRAGDAAAAGWSSRQGSTWP